MSRILLLILFLLFVPKTMNAEFFNELNISTLKKFCVNVKIYIPKLVTPKFPPLFFSFYSNFVFGLNMKNIP